MNNQKSDQTNNASHEIPSRVIDLLLNVILDVMQAESGSIMLTSKKSDALTIQSSRGLREEIIKKSSVRLGCGISGKVAADGRPLLIKKQDWERRCNIDSIDLIRPDIETSYIVPLTLIDGSVGTVNINSIKIPLENLEEKHGIIQDILTRFYEYLVQTQMPTPDHIPPSDLYMMNIFREYNVIRELRIVFDYIFQLITDISGIQKKGVFCLKNKESGFFDLVLGYGFQTKNYRDIYEDLIPCLKSTAVETQCNIKIFNKQELSLTARNFEENYLILFPLATNHKNKNTVHGQLVLLNDEPPEIISKKSDLLKTICSIAAETIDKSNSNRNYHDLTYTDSLTGTYNYGLWWKRLNEEYSRSTRENEIVISLLLLDVDHFNRINLSHGYMAGDQVLRFIADKIKSCVRSNDIVGRIGGEEFGVILIQSSKESAMMIANRILQTVSNMSREMNIDLEVPVTLSGGIASLPIDADTPDTLVEKARIAMVSAKIMGGNNIKEFDTLEE
ncbi:MAG: diguanylate cyclase [Desulfamplus sp.]|nr:diguanylate cyclase [Desulfamplus sp.]